MTRLDREPRERGRRRAAVTVLSCAGLLAIGAAWAPSVDGPVLCPLRALTGIPCPTCGLTRSVCATLHGQWEAALDLHPLGPVVVVLAIALAILGLGELAERWRVLGRLRPLASPVFFAALALEMVLIWPPRLAASFEGGVRPLLARGLVTRPLLEAAAPATFEPAGRPRAGPEGDLVR